MPQYLLHDWDPAAGLSLEDWAQDLADKSWRTWAGSGAWTVINGRRVFRVSLRREPHYLKAELRSTAVGV